MSSLCQSFVDLAALTSRRMDAAIRTGLVWSEETNTETLLLELEEQHPKKVAVVAFTKRREALNGSDWEWWIGDRGKWLGMRVQAKRAGKGKNKFDRLKTYAAAGQTQTQIEILISSARSCGLVPIYCFYVSSLVAPWQTLDGCLIGHAAAVQAAPSNRYSDLAKVVVPWQRLVCSAPVAPKSSEMHPAMRALTDSLQAVGLKDIEEFSTAANLPAYARRLLETPLLERGNVRLSMLDEARAAERRVAGIVVMNLESGDGSE